MSQTNIEKLNNPEMIEKFDQAIESLIASDSISEARAIRDILVKIFSDNPDFNKVNASLFSVYSRYLVAAKYLTLFDLNENEIIQLFKDNFDFVLNHSDYDLARKLDYKIRDILDLEKRDIFKEKLRQAIANCNLKLGEGKIEINGVVSDSTVSNWMKDYNINVGIDRADPLKLSEYFIKNRNLRTLDDTGKGKLKRLLDIFERLKVSSQELPMFEENLYITLPDQGAAIIESGQPRRIDDSIIRLAKEASNIVDKPLIPETPKSSVAAAVSVPSPSKTAELEESLKSYPPASLEYKAIKQEINRLNKAGKNIKATTNAK